MFEAIYDNLVEFHRAQPYLIKAMLAGTLVSVVCAVIGCFVILRRMAFLGDAIAHSMLAGVVAGFLLMRIVFHIDVSAVGMLIGSIIAGFITVAMVAFVSRVSRIKEDTAIGAMYTGIFAAGALLVSLFSDKIHIDLYHFVVGTVLAVDDSQLWMMAIVAAFVISVVILLFRQLQLTSFDPVMAASIGVPVLAIDYLLTACTSLVVVSAVNIVGVILVVGMLVTPAATAYLLCDRLNRMLWVSALFGVSSFYLGYYISAVIRTSPGPAIVVASTVQFMLVLTIAPRYGLIANWLRRQRALPQQLVEDVLGCILRSKRQKVALSVISQHVQAPFAHILRAIRSLAREELLSTEADTVSLTREGRREARRLLRAHRLWESYLEHVGTPVEELHAAADRLEHLHDEAAVDYLDDKLGHPLTDPHGAEIPEDFVHLVPGTEINASLLRRGHRATVTRIAQGADDLPVEVGAAVSVGPRQQAGKKWTLILEDGREVLLDHKTADSITVVLEEPHDQ